MSRRIIVAVTPGLAASLAVLLAAGVVRGLCDPLQGLGFFLVGPASSSLASASLAAVIALVAGVYLTFTRRFGPPPQLQPTEAGEPTSS